MTNRSSRLSGFYKKSIADRVNIVAEWANLSAAEKAILAGQGLQPTQADLMIENVVGTYALPLGIGTNFQINGKDYLIPMTVEEPSVVAAISHAAKLIRAGGGFTAETSEPVMIGQIQLLDIPDMEAAIASLAAHKDELMALANSSDALMVRLGGGARDIQLRPFSDSPVGPMLIIHLLYDTRDAMGANAVNTAVELMAPRIAELTGGRTLLRILSNLADQRTATARGVIPAAALAKHGISGPEAAQRIAEANAFAVVDPYRAATHNKGIMNGIDAVVMATGNDWRAIEAGAHAFAARNGRYSALTDWHVNKNGDLYGEITLPMAVGTVGGATKVHPSAKVAIKILNVQSAQELAQLLACVGLAQNLAAIKALATVGIQRGHMRLHARQVATAAGASPEQVPVITERMIADHKINIVRAQEILTELNSQ
ncbi:MAG: hydroxymethylglutaryl-CoA reductase, degradative [Chloroflexi bacterium]|nr:MAG: hydroxymethylglutaryl-CoA reductase, degradative [Chloroflexota bacterium]